MIYPEQLILILALILGIFVGFIIYLIKLKYIENLLMKSPF